MLEMVEEIGSLGEHTGLVRLTEVEDCTIECAAITLEFGAKAFGHILQDGACTRRVIHRQIILFLILADT